MLGFLKKLRRDKRGNILVLGAAAMPVFIGAAGMATDTILWALWKRELQRAADSAAMAGALTVQQNAYQAERAAQHDFRKSNAFKQLGGVMRFHNAPVSGPWKGDRNAVYINIWAKRPLPFSNFFLGEAPKILAEATASLTYGVANCLIALDEIAPQSISFEGETNLLRHHVQLPKQQRNHSG